MVSNVAGSFDETNHKEERLRRNPFVCTKANEYGLFQVIGFAFSETDFPYDILDCLPIFFHAGSKIGVAPQHHLRH